MNLPDDLNIEEALSKAIDEAVKGGIQEVTSALLKDAVSDTIRSMSAEAAGALLGSVASNLLKALLKVQDNVLKRVDSLLREPFETGIRVANEAMTLPVNTPAETQFRQMRLRFAVEKLDEAETIALRQRESAAQNVIEMIQAFCLSQLSGAELLARKRASSVIARLHVTIQGLHSEIEKLRAEAADCRAAAARELEKLATWPDVWTTLLNPKKPANYRIQSDIYIAAAEGLERQIATLQDKSSNLKSICHVLKRI